MAISETITAARRRFQPRAPQFPAGVWEVAKRQTGDATAGSLQLIVVMATPVPALEYFSIEGFIPLLGAAQSFSVVIQINDFLGLVTPKTPSFRTSFAADVRLTEAEARLPRFPLWYPVITDPARVVVTYTTNVNAMSYDTYLWGFYWPGVVDAEGGPRRPY